MVTSLSPLNIWIYRHGYIRLSRFPFSLSTMERGVHLTNNAVQSQYHTDVADPLTSDGCMLSLHDFWTRYASPQKRRSVCQSVQQIVRDTIIACTPSFESTGKSFELYGFDFLLDSQYKVWLLEVNASPCLTQSSTIVTKLIRSMLPSTLESIAHSFLLVLFLSPTLSLFFSLHLSLYSSDRH